MSLAVDEYGNPFIILRDQEKSTRLKGIEAHTSNILAARSVADTLLSSLGPKGMDKIICSSDNDVTVTNDGATILSKMDVSSLILLDTQMLFSFSYQQIEHQCAKLLVELANSQDDEIGDGTTGVVIFAGALLDKCTKLLRKGLHPLVIADAFDEVAEIAIQRITDIAVAVNIEEDNYEVL
jgi:T-complex protein 1 subunit epsilon